MGKNKRGDVFALWLVFIVVAMMGIVLYNFYLQEENVQGLVVSPMRVLAERDNLEIFEGREIELIKNSLESASGDFGSEEFFDSFRRTFILGVMNDDEMLDFIYSNLTVGGVEILDEDKNQNLVENGVYPKSKSSFSEDKITFVRSRIGKSYILETGDFNDVSFPMRFNFDFERKYLIKEGAYGFSVSKVE